MTKSELIERIAQKQSQLVYRDVELAVKAILEHMAERLAGGGRIEIRGFGSFSLHFRSGRVGRNPKTGTPVSLPAKYVPHFKPGKKLRERVNRETRWSLEADSRPDSGPGATPSLSASDPAPVYGHEYTSSGGRSGGA
jgi:integration host factor subunit beta